MRIAHFGQTVAEDGTLDSAAAWRERLDELAQMVEQAAQSIESAYAQSMTRLSSSFRKAQTELTRRLDQARLLNLSVRQELEVLIKEVEKETQNYIKHRKTIEGARSVARRTRKLMKKARSFRASTYLKVERGQVLEFRERLSRLSAAVGVLKLDDAIGVAEELVALTNSMEFSLKLSIRYSQDERLVKQSRKELSKVRDARKLAEQIQARLSVLRPQRSRLRSLRSENLEALNTSLDELHKQVLQIRGEVDGLTKRFPIFFSKFGPALEQISEALRQTREKLGELMLEESFRLSVYMDDNLIRLVETLTNATRNARTAHALAAGGAQPSLDIAGKEEHMSVEQLESYLQLGANLGKRKEWQVVIDKYFSLLSP
jgi:hypothetical protein